MITEIDIVHSLSTLPANDGNFKSALERAKNEDIEKAIQKMKDNGGQNKGRISACEREIHKRKRLEKC